MCPEFVSKGGNWVRKEQYQAPKPKVVQEVKKVEKKIEKVVVTNSKPKKGRK